VIHFPCGKVAERQEAECSWIGSWGHTIGSDTYENDREADICKRFAVKGVWKVTYRAALIAVAIVCAGVAAASGQDIQWFTGSWEAEIGLSPQETMPFSTFYSTLDVGLHLGILEVSSISDFLVDGWLWQEFDLEVGVGPFCFNGQMLFEPQSGSFIYAQGMLQIDISPVTVGLYSAMVGPTQSESANYGYVFEVSGDILPGLVCFRSSTFLGADRSEITFSAPTSQTDSSLVTKTYLIDPTADALPIQFCGQEFEFGALALNCIEFTSLTTFSKTGFVSEEIEVAFIRLFGLPLTITLNVLFELQTKSFVFTPSLETDYGCLTIYSNILGSSGLITGLEVYGIAFSATFGGATLTSISNLDTSQYVITTPEFGLIVESLADAVDEGHIYYPQNYWEIVSIDVEVPPMGSGFSFSVDTFFSTENGLLFDWAESTMGLTLALGASVSTSTAISIDTTGFTAWTISFLVSW